MSKISKNAVGLIAFLLAQIGVAVTEEAVAVAVFAVVEIASFVFLVWNQLGRKDVAKFLFKR